MLPGADKNDDLSGSLFGGGAGVGGGEYDNVQTRQRQSSTDLRRQLKDRSFGAGVDPTKLEEHLQVNEFQELFGMTKVR